MSKCLLDIVGWGHSCTVLSCYSCDAELERLQLTDGTVVGQVQAWRLDIRGLHWRMAEGERKPQRELWRRLGV